jgi:hypothetical protein
MPCARVYRPALLDQAVLEHIVHHHDGTTEVLPPGDAHGAGGEVTPRAESLTRSMRPPWTADELVVAALGEIVHARAGGKGGDANLGVWVRNRAAWVLTRRSARTSRGRAPSCSPTWSPAPVLRPAVRTAGRGKPTGGVQGEAAGRGQPISILSRRRRSSAAVPPGL